MNEKDKKVAYFLNQIVAYLCIFLYVSYSWANGWTKLAEYLEGTHGYPGFQCFSSLKFYFFPQNF